LKSVVCPGRLFDLQRVIPAAKEECAEVVTTRRRQAMGRNKEYRQRLKYQVSSALKKTLENQISVELRQNVGFSLAEAELIKSISVCKIPRLDELSVLG
jgi:hypothetical protein